jgi:hypothetical protein
MFIPQSGAAELPSIRGAANIGRRATDDDPLTFLKLLEIDVFVVSLALGPASHDSCSLIRLPPAVGSRFS